MSLEAAAGMNPRSHTGKIYNLLADRIARALVREMADVEHAQCFLLSRIGSPIDEPALAEMRLSLPAPGALAALEPAAGDIVRAHLRDAALLWQEVIAGRCQVC
jgi:S-adenosylmethionine synthetase